VGFERFNPPEPIEPLIQRMEMSAATRRGAVQRGPVKRVPLEVPLVARSPSAEGLGGKARFYTSLLARNDSHAVMVFVPSQLRMYAQWGACSRSEREHLLPH